MPRVALAAFTLPLLLGCSALVSAPFHITSRANFDPAERRAVWGRAVTSLQITGALVKVSDPLGGVLLSEAQPTSTRCGNAVSLEHIPKGETTVCPATVVVQFTMTDDGVAFLRINRGVIGRARFGKSLFKEEDHAAIKTQCDEWLRYIVGTSPKPPDPTPPPPPGIFKM